MGIKACSGTEEEQLEEELGAEVALWPLMRLNHKKQWQFMEIIKAAAHVISRYTRISLPTVAGGTLSCSRGKNCFSGFVRENAY